MSARVASRMLRVQKSIISEISRVASEQKIISFVSGNPSAETFDCQMISEIVKNAFRQNLSKMLVYGETLGYEPLRNALKQRLSKKWKFDFSDNDLMITNGGQQNCDLVAKTLLERNDIVLSEEPSFPNCFATFLTYDAKIVGIPLENDGMRPEDLKRAIKDNQHSKMIYITPNFQNPTGCSTILQKRREINSLAEEFGLAIFEDDPYGELRFSGADILPLKSLDVKGQVFYGGSFSKTLAPGIRLGYLVYNKALENNVAVAKQTADVHTSTLMQLIVYELLMTGYDEHLSYCRRVYSNKSRVMREALTKYAPEELSWNTPEGGFFLSVFFPRKVDTREFALKMLSKGVACVPGNAFMINGKRQTNMLRLCYSTVTEEQIEEGIKLLCIQAKEWLNSNSN